MSNNLGLDPFPDHDLGFLIWGFQDQFAFPRRRKANEKLLGWKNLFCESWSERPSYYREVTPVFYFGSVSWPWRCCRRCGVAGGERVPPAPLGWYFFRCRFWGVICKTKLSVFRIFSKNWFSPKSVLKQFWAKMPKTDNFVLQIAPQKQHLQKNQSIPQRSQRKMLRDRN